MIMFLFIEDNEMVEVVHPQTNPEYFATSPLSSKSSIAYTKGKPLVVAKAVPVPTVPMNSGSLEPTTKRLISYDHDATYQQPRLQSFRRT